MPELIDRRGLTGEARVDRGTHRTQIAIEKIDVTVLDHQPAAAVDAGTPRAERSQQIFLMAIVELLRRTRQLVN